MNEEQLAIIADMDKEIANIIRNFESKMPQQESLLLKKMESLLQKMEVKNGNIIPSVKNLAIAKQIKTQIALFGKNPSLKTATSELFAGLESIKILCDAYFSSIVADFKGNAELFKQVVAETIKNTTNSIRGQGLTKALTPAVQKIMVDNIKRGRTFETAKKQLEQHIIANSKQVGALQRYTSQIVTDATMQFNRQYLEAVTEDLGLKWYYYTGAGKTTSRGFCKHRQGKYFHKSQVEKWASLQWSGKIPTTTKTTIFTYLGGYHCGHRLVPIHESAVPESTKTRAI